MRRQLRAARALHGWMPRHALIHGLPARALLLALGIAFSAPAPTSWARPLRSESLAGESPADDPSSPAGTVSGAAEAGGSPAGESREGSDHARTAGGVGFDIRFGLPNGLLSAPASLGADLTWNPVAPLVTSVGVDSNVVTWSVHAEAQLNLLSFFDPEASLSPFVRGGFSYARFTRFSDDLIDRFAPSLREDLQDAGTDLRFAGVGMKLATVSAGLDYLSPDGFHFQLAVGRAVLLGESRGRDDEESVVLTEYASWTFQLMFGAVFF